MADVRPIELKDEEADLLYNKTKNRDPFDTQIPPALLNSSDIVKYVESTGMLNPFYIGEEFLKPASYSLRVNGTYIYWNSKEEMIQGELAKAGDYIVLKRNTVAFVTLESKIRLPHYIAARFNLQIKHVHRGILLGTGPLVDPGFKGNLFIPLHNLTNNDYKIEYLDPLIWMEFTKISNSSDYVNNMGEKRKENFFPFKNSSVSLSPGQYLNKAAPHSPIINSVSLLVERASELQKKAEDVIGRINLTALMSIITLCIGLGTFMYNTLNIRKETMDYVLKNVEKQQALENRLDSLVKNLNSKDQVIMSIQPKSKEKK